MPTYTVTSVIARKHAVRHGAVRRGASGRSAWCVAAVTCLMLAAAAPVPAAAQMAARALTVVAEPTTYAELWQAAQAAVDAGEFERDESVRTALYAKATAYARRAVALNPNDPEGHFHLSRALGRTALALGPRERVKYGIEVREQALAALKVAPRHPGALHVMGVWNAEIMRLSGISRAVARAFLGGQVFGTASWAEAQRYIETAVQIEPERLVHRLDQARIYRDVGRKDDARAAYRLAIAAPAQDTNDAMYRQQASEELRKLK